ncbi:hypothetical protein J5X84_42570 [Streptosporangiaceae bacterium NEAU-GS5]|nr:hypothetical protein [Streptosporangiaceae bacterium NEAU-GS5]
MFDLISAELEARLGEEFAAAPTLPDFLAKTSPLSAAERRLIASQALVLLEQNYAHLPLKTTRYAINPAQRLRLLIARIDEDGAGEPEWRFHAELLDIFTSLRDLHTRYTLPHPFSDAVAFLPFRIKEFTGGDRLRYLVAPLRPGAPAFPEGPFQPEAELIHWNGVPVARAVEVFGERLPGANPAARRARAVDFFTVRSLGMTGPPDEDFVTIGFTDLQGAAREIRVQWKVTLPQTPADQALAGESELCVDVEALRVAEVRTRLFAPDVVARRSGARTADAAPGAIEVPAAYAGVFEARRTGTGFGYLRIRTFVSPDDDIAGMVRQFIGLIDQLPPNGLILDIRGNPGGHGVAAELMLQALTARPFQPEPFQFLSTSLNLRICRGDQQLAAWRPSLEQAVETGAAYSAGFPLTAPRLLPLVPQVYFGPVVLLTDARCYSAADLFAAGFQDNGIGTVIGQDPTTGAGGANVWKTARLLQSMNDRPDSPYRPLPSGAEFSVAIRRMLRVGPNTGTPVEDFGVRPDVVVPATRADVVGQDADLLARAAEELSRMKPRRFEALVTEGPTGVAVTVDAHGVDRADIVLDGRPMASLDVGAGTVSTMVSGTVRDEVAVIGHDAATPVATRLFRRPTPGSPLTLLTTLHP